jgi:protein TonB
MLSRKFSALFLFVLFLSACSPTKEAVKRPVDNSKPAEKIFTVNIIKEPVKISKANSLAAYQRELAMHISQTNSSKVYTGNPQAMLRAVLVMKFSIDAKGKLLKKDFVRSNHDKEAEATAIASLVNAQAFPQPPSFLLEQGRLEIIETWLFNTDGRFQLRTIALPQANE